MNNKSRIYVALLLLLLLLPATVGWAEFPKYPWLDTPFLPYIIFAVGLALSCLFHKGREFNLFLILTVSFSALSQFFWAEGLAGFQKELLFNLISILIPLNFLIFNYLRECGILSQCGLKRLVFVGAQITAAYCLLKTNQYGISTYISVDILVHPYQGKTIIKQSGLLAICLSLAVLGTHRLFHPDQFRGAWILALISVIMALHCILNTQLATVYFMIAGLILISAIIFNSSDPA